MKYGTENILRKDKQALKLIENRLKRDCKGTLKTLEKLRKTYEHRPDSLEFWYDVNNIMEVLNDVLDVVEQ